MNWPRIAEGSSWIKFRYKENKDQRSQGWKYKVEGRKCKIQKEKGKLLNALKKSTQRKKDNEEVIKSLTKTNTDINGENKTLKKLYMEEMNKHQSKEASKQNVEKFKDYDNLEDDSTDDEDDAFKVPINTSNKKRKQSE